MDCGQCLEVVSATLDGEAGDEERRAAEEHLAGCAACARTRDGLLRQDRALRLRVVDPSPSPLVLTTDVRPQRRSLQMWGAAAALLVAVGAAALWWPDGGTERPDVTVHEARASRGPSGGVSEVYFYVTNNGERDDRVVAVTSPRAEVAQIHVTETSGGLATMRTVQSLPLPVSSSARLRPDGVHVMLVGLRDDVEPGDSIPLTLVLERGGVLTVSATVSEEPLQS